MKEDPPITSLSKYLRENQHLFTIIGIFSALTVYLSQLPIQSAEQYIPIPELATTAGFGLVLLISLVAAYDGVGRLNRADHRVMSFKNIPIGAFLCLFVFLLLAIARALIQFEEAVATTSIVMIQLGAFVVHVAFLYWLDRIGVVDNIQNRFDYSYSTVVMGLLVLYILFSIFVVGILVVVTGGTDINSYRPSASGFTKQFYILAVSQFLAVGIRIYLLALLLIGVYRVWRFISGHLSLSMSDEGA